MIRRIFRVLIPFGILLLGLSAIAICTEVALGVRAYFSASDRSPTAAPGDFKVLLVGDSVLGFIDRDPKGLAGRVKAAVPKGIAVSEISEPALLSKKIVDTAKDVATSRNPDLVVLMIGKADVDSALTEAPEGIQALRTVRFLRFLWGDLQARYSRWSDFEKVQSSRQFRLDTAWAAYAKFDCATALPMFAELLIERHDFLSDIPHGRAMYFCFLHEKRYDEGVQFFSDLASLSKDGSIYRMYSGSLKLHSGGDDLKLQQQARQEIEGAVNSVDARASFKTRLWLAKTSAESSTFTNLLRRMTVEQSTSIDPRTVENIRKILREFVGRGSRVLFLQYPTDHVDVWKTNFTEFGDAVSFVELRQWLLDLPENDIPLAVDDDIEHLTEAGADRLAPKLLQEIEAQIQKRK